MSKEKIMSGNVSRINQDNVRSNSSKFTLPSDPLNRALSDASPLDIHAVFARARVRSTLRREALTLYGDGVKELLHEQLTGALQQAKLEISTAKRKAYNDYLERNADLTIELEKRIDRFVATSQESLFDTFESAMNTLQKSTERVEKMRANGADSGYCDSMENVARELFESRTHLAHERLDKFIAEMNEQVELVVSKFKASMETQSII